MTTGEIWVALALAVDIAFRVIALVIVPRNRRPQTAMAWLLAIFFIPYFGFLAFLAFGSRRGNAYREGTHCEPHLPRG